MDQVSTTPDAAMASEASTASAALTRSNTPCTAPSRPPRGTSAAAMVPAAQAPRAHVLVVAGASGEPAYAAAFHQAATAIAEAARTRLGVAAADVEYLGEDPARAAPNHSPFFRVDESGLLPGLRAMLHLTADYTGSTGA